MSSVIAQATYRWDSKLEVSFPYSRHLVEQLKIHIPVPGREWVPERRIWIIDQPWATTAIRLMREVCGNVIVEDRRSTYQDPFPPTGTPQIDPDFATLYVLETAPLCVVTAAYKALSKQCHPDRVPERERVRAHEEMIALTNAYDAVRDRVAS